MRSVIQPKQLSGEFLLATVKAGLLSQFAGIKELRDFYSMYCGG